MHQLRDSHSYETQIIDAVRSVNRALGGTYGTSSAIYKNEFNQYEVQLIDAIRGIGRTLSGNGLSLAGGGGASSKELQDLARRVSQLESESFFRLVDGNVTLKEQYRNLWVPGWLAAGGIGTGGGGGGAAYLNDLEDVTIDISTLANGDVLTWDSTAGLWVNKPGGGGSYTLPPATTTTLGGIIVGSGLAITASGVLSVSGGSVNGYIGTTQVQSTSQPQALTGITSVKLSSSSSLFEWDSTNSAWHFHGNVYSDGWIAAGGTGTPGGGGGGADLSDVWNSLTNTVTDQWAATKINLAHIPNITASMVSDLATWASNNLYTLRTHVSTTAANGTLLGVDALSNGSTSTAGQDSSRIEWDGTNGAWHVYGNLYADGWVSAGGIGIAGGGSVDHLYDIGDVTLSSLTDGQALVWDDTNSVWKNATIGNYTLPTASSSVLGGIKVGSGLAIDANGVLSATGGAAVSYIDRTSIMATVQLGTLRVGSTDYEVYTYPPGGSQVSVTQVLSSGTKIATIYVDTVTTDIYAPSGGGGVSLADVWSSLTGSTGTYGSTKINASHIPDLSGTYVTLSTTQNNISGEKTFTTNPVHIGSSSGLDVHSSSYIDIGNARLVYDSGTNALHITKKSGTQATIGLYADGFVAAGGVAGQTTSSYVDLESAQTIGGAKTFTSAMSLSSTLNINGVTLSGSSTRLDVNKNTRFLYKTSTYISISDIVDRIVALENA